MRIVIDGPPVVQQRPRKGKHGQFYDPSAVDKKRLGMALLTWRVTHKVSILDGNLGVKATFYGNGKFDVDNALKALLDAGTGILWKDDRQIKEIYAAKHEEGRTRTKLKVYSL